jgi:hypothetical protein
MSRETTTADFWGTLMRWIVALAASVVAFPCQAGTRPVFAPRVAAPASEEVPGTSPAPRSVSVLRWRAWLRSSVRPWTLAGFGLPSSSPPSTAPT